MRFAGPLTPKQAAAFWKLGILNGDDLRRLAFQWLEEGIASDAVAILAGEQDTTVREHGVLFERVLRECQAAVPSEPEAAWLYIQTILHAVSDGYDPLDGAHDILTMDRRGVALFPLRYLAGEGRPFAGEELGIEGILGLYYELDDVDLRPKDALRAMQDLRAECARVLVAFYTEPPPEVSDDQSRV